MKIFVKARPNSREEEVRKLDEQTFAVSIKEPPVAGKANEAIVRVLGEHFGVSRSHIKIFYGWTSKNKVVEIIGME